MHGEIFGKSFWQAVLMVAFLAVCVASNNEKIENISNFSLSAFKLFFVAVFFTFDVDVVVVVAVVVDVVGSVVLIDDVGIFVVVGLIALTYALPAF